MGPRHDLSSKYSNFIFPDFLSRMDNMGIFNASSKFDCQILSYKQVTEFELLCFINKARKKEMV